MRVVQWHGWLLDGSGSNVYAARVTERLRAAGHEVLLLCQEPRPERYGFIDAWGAVSGEGVGDLTERAASGAAGRAVLLRPDIGTLLPVFVVDEYEGFIVKRFVDLTDGELESYLDLNVAAVRAAIEWHGADVLVMGHAIPGSVIGRRVAGPRGYVAKIHGSDLEYAIRIDPRLRELAAEGLAGARAIVGASEDVLERASELIPEASGPWQVITPGVDVRFRPRTTSEGLDEAASALETDPDTAQGRPGELDDRVRAALGARDADALSALAGAYDQAVPDRDAAARLSDLRRHAGPIVAFFGKLIPQKGLHLLLQAACLLPQDIRVLVVGFGRFREWLHALVLAIDAGDPELSRWVGRSAEMHIELTDDELARGRGLADRVTFTGRLDHRYAPGALSASRVLVVPSILDEAFGMVAAEGAAAGSVPLMARHSGLAEIAMRLERGTGRRGLFSFEPGPGSPRRIAAGVQRILAEGDDALGRAVHEIATREWSWDRTAELLLAAALA